MYPFENSYKEVLEETKSKVLALKNRSSPSKNVLFFNRLTDVEYEQIVSILKESPFPEKIVEKIVIGMDSKTGLRAFQNSEFLTKMANVRRDT